jgi:ABC-type hemin transport system ATPase subunit
LFKIIIRVLLFRLYLIRLYFERWPITDSQKWFFKDTGNASFQIASESGSLETVKYLVEKGANVNATVKMITTRAVKKLKFNQVNFFNL